MTGNAPQGASYAAPLVGFQIGQSLASLPDQYMKGRENSRKIAMEDAFPKGVPTNPDGSVDVNAVVDKGAKIGGLPFVQGMLPFLQQMAIGKQASDALSATDPGSQPSGGAAAPQSSQPSPMRNNPSASGPAHLGVQQPALSGNGSDVGDQGAPTLRSMATEYSGGREAPIGSIARQLRINPDAPLSAEQQTQVKTFLSQAARPTGSEDVVAQNGPSGASEQGAGAPNGQNAAPFAAGGASGSPPPSQGGQSGATPGPRHAEAVNLSAAARTLRAKAAQLSAMKNPEAAQPLLKQADTFDARAKTIFDAETEDTKRTPEQKNALDPRVEQSKGLEVAQKQELTRGDALQKGLQGASREFETALKPHLDAMRGILNDPNFVSGTGVGFQEALNKIRSSPLFKSLPGYDPNAALPNEAIRKVVAASILNQTTELKAEAAEMGGSAGRLFQQQISLMEKAAQNPENTAPALRYLTELQQRMGDHARKMAELANNYQGKYGKGVLDNGFNDVLSKFNSDPKNQIYSPAEIADQRLFAPPIAPRLESEADRKSVV